MPIDGAQLTRKIQIHKMIPEEFFLLRFFFRKRNKNLQNQIKL